MPAGGGGSVGGTQIINGQPYQMYTPQWYDATRRNNITTATNAGQAAGAGASAFWSQLNQNPALASLFGIGGGVGTGSTVAFPGSVSTGTTASTPTVAPVAPVDTTAAQAAAFARAKDQAAQTAAASLRALQGTLASRGMGGAGYEAGQIGTTLAGAANTIGEASRTQAEDEAALREREAAQNQGAAITQRGQDISANTAAGQRATEEAIAQFQGGVAERGQDIQARTAALQSLRSLFGANLY